MDSLDRLCERYENLGARYGLRKRVAEVSGLSPEHVSRLMGRKLKNTTVQTLDSLSKAIDQVERELKSDKQKVGAA